MIGTKGIIRYDRGSELFEMRNDKGLFTFDFSPEKNFAALYVHYRDALEQGGSDLLPTGLDGLMAAKISRESVERLMARHAKR